MLDTVSASLTSGVQEAQTEPTKDNPSALIQSGLKQAGPQHSSPEPTRHSKSTSSASFSKPVHSGPVTAGSHEAKLIQPTRSGSLHDPLRNHGIHRPPTLPLDSSSPQRLLHYYTMHEEDFKQASASTVPMPDLATSPLNGERDYSSSNTFTMDGVGHVSDGTGWSALSRTIRRYDEAKISDCKEDIDTLLVFAGLFSAVVTAFVLESFKMLEPNNSTVTAASQFDSSQFEPSFAALRINILWFSSLVFSLTTASLSMLVKQWLREYMVQECISPQERSRIRHFRYSRFKKWRVLQLAGALPLLLHLALLLFFIGLSDFLRSINQVVGFIVTSLIILWFVVWAGTIISPIVSADSPFKTPIFKPLFKHINHAVYRLLHYNEENFMQDGFPGDEDVVRKEMSSDVNILTSSDALFLDDKVLRIIKECLSTASLAETARCVKELIGNRVQYAVRNLQSVYLTGVPYKASRVISEIALDALNRQVENSEVDRQPLEWSSYFEDTFMFVLNEADRVCLDISGMLERALVQGPDACIHVLNLLSFHTGDPPHLSLALPTTTSITEPGVLPNLIAACQQILNDPAQTLSPTRCFAAFLTLSLHTSDNVLMPYLQAISYHSEKLRDIYLRKLSSQAQQDNIWPSLQRQNYLEDTLSTDICIAACTQFETRFPGVLDRALIRVLNETRGNHSVPPTMPNAWDNTNGPWTQVLTEPEFPISFPVPQVQDSFKSPV
ncbi:hypothetical protein C8Q75DRAFT_805401 [Abortiporus biennis]|nr:hypothetical protein C8Q75DRAFT_805401 [Abortiporus biennis]